MSSTADSPWGYSDITCPERWGHAISREEAIAAGRNEYEGKPFYIISGQYPSPATFMPDAEDIIEMATERAHDNAGEIADEWPDATPEATAELDGLLSAWAHKHAPVRFWLAVGEPERIDRAGEDP